MKKPKGLNSSPIYTRFVKDRDRALERVHYNAQLRHADILRDVFTRSIQTLVSSYSAVKNQLYSPHGRKLFIRASSHVDSLFDLASLSLFHEATKLRRSTFILSIASEAEAIRRTMGWDVSDRMPHMAFKALEDRKLPSGGHMMPTIQLYLGRVKAKLVDAVRTAAIQDYPQEELIPKLIRALPRQEVARPNRKIIAKPKLTEADKPARVKYEMGQMMPSSLYGVISEDDWDRARDDYLTDYVPQTRSPEYTLLGEDVDPKDQYYAWELEQDMTNDFVKSVRDGQVAAATANGITEFIWIAVVDNVTDECCLWRDGLLTSEIEAKLDGDHKDDECDTSVPPAHFNCRCTMAPATDNIPDVPDTGQGDFDEWLNGDGDKTS